METLQTIKGFLARLAGAPVATRPRPARHASGLYQCEATASIVGAPRRAPASPPALTGPASTRTSKQRDGDDGEAFARCHLERAGLVFVAANVLYRDGELDLVMRELPRTREARSGGATLVFVEVRRRARGSHGGAAASITRDKQRRVVAAAAHYLVGLGLRVLPSCRFDVVTLDGDVTRGFRVEWIRDAFRDEG